MKSSILSIAFVIAIASCATVTVSSPPSGSDVAYLKFVGNSMQSGLLRIYKNPDNCSGAVAIPSDQNPFIAGANPVVIEGNKDVSFFLTTVRGVASCQIFMTFHTVPGHTYVADSSSLKNKCSIEIFDVTKSFDRTALQREPTQRQREKTTPFLDTGAFCK
jgi:hypothetical protein